MVVQHQTGFSLVEMMLATLLSVSLSVAATEWFISILSLTRSQQISIESNEIGRFVLRYMEINIEKAGAGTGDQPAISFSGDDLIVRYQSELPLIGEVRNCLGNKISHSLVVDRLSVEAYELGGKELKCSSGRLVDWITEGIDDISYEVAVDQGSFLGTVFESGRLDGVPDQYVSASEFNPELMNPVALRVVVTAYKPIESNPFKSNYWQRSSPEDFMSRKFTTLVVLPNG